MNRTEYFDYIEEKLNLLATRINARGKLNILNLNIQAETFYAYFIYELYGWKLNNENASKQNIEAIDLIDDTNKIVIQVSATSTKEKIESALKKDIIKQYATYTFKFISIANDSDDLRRKTFANPHGINFNPSNDIIDKKSILNHILGSYIDDQRKIYEFIKKELGSEIDIVKLDSNLATIINILAKENWEEHSKESNVNSFEIERKIDHNQLDKTKQIIQEYKVYHYKVDEKYEEFDAVGSNKSYSVLQLISKCYVAESIKSDVPDRVFLNTSEKVMEKVQNSLNFIKIESDILILCVDILVVDAFIRCKIFENPSNYNYATSR